MEWAREGVDYSAEFDHANGYFLVLLMLSMHLLDHNVEKPFGMDLTVLLCLMSDDEMQMTD